MPASLASAKCSFYLPKEATAALLEEGKANLHRMQQEIHVTDDEKSAVDDGIKALTKPAERLAEAPAPDGYIYSWPARAAKESYVSLASSLGESRVAQPLLAVRHK